MNKEISPIWDLPWVQLLFGVYTKLVFFALNLFTLPLVLIAERFVLPKERPRLWRLVAKKNTAIFLRIAHIELDIRATFPDHDIPVIYVSNHPSALDGFIYFFLLGPDLIPLTAPFKSFPFPFGIWFRKMGSVDVQRDDYDIAHYPEANEKKDAIQKIISNLIEHRSVLIFPEGHYERTSKLHYLHTGAARISVRAKVPIVPMSLIGLEEIHVDKIRMRPGRVIIRFDGLLYPPAVSKEKPFRAATTEYAEKIAKEIISLLPVHYLPNYIDDYAPETIGAFVDIDNTIYKGYSQQDFVKYLFKNKKLSPWLAFKIFYWVFLEKFHLMPHKQLMRASLSLLKDWKISEIEKLSKEFFEENILEHIQKHMIPIMKDHQKQGHVIVFVTEVIHPLAKCFCDYFKATTSLDTMLERKDGKYTGEVEQLAYKEEKARLVKDFATRFGIDLSKSYVYADSASDIPMFELVKYKTAVHPDPELKKVATIHNWEILS